MCIGIPMQVENVNEGIAQCVGRGERAALDCALIDAPAPGTWVLAFRGAAMRVLSATEAAQTNAALDALAAVLAGEAVTDAHFADLVGRQPELPMHLRGKIQ
ncbi:MAG: HypC/HybG/HupF family hydrogenase formation chaperone [Burkholderiales bacterium]|nr:HypC/HybG/HupF family hydrogenase formation chaperone [Burkholderiales bacterium]